MTSNSPFRSPVLAVLGFIAAVLAMTVFWLLPMSSAHASSLTRAHYKTPLHPHYTSPVQPVDDQPARFHLSPEQEAVVNWVIDSASPKMGYEQARKIVRYSYEQAESLNIDPLAFIAIMRLESRFNPRAVSSHGARGLMQVMPKIHKAKLAGRSPYDIETSIDVGAQILGECLDKNPGQLTRALNCYSGGGGKAYHALFVHFHHQADRYIVFSLFDTPETPPAPSGPDVAAQALPSDEAVYQIALK